MIECKKLLFKFKAKTYFQSGFFITFLYFIRVAPNRSLHFPTTVFRLDGERSNSRSRRMSVCGSKMGVPQSVCQDLQLNAHCKCTHHSAYIGTKQ